VVDQPGPSLTPIDITTLPAPTPVVVDPTPDPKVEALKDVGNRFSYHPPKGDQANRYTVMRDLFRQLAEYIVLNTPASREQSTALSHLDAASMFSNASIARNE
jgi:hypothetical protein